MGRAGKKAITISSTALRPRKRSKLKQRRNTPWHWQNQTYGFFIPTVSLLGVGAAKDAGTQEGTWSDQSSYRYGCWSRENGVADQIKKLITDAGLKAVIYSGAEPNPTDKNVRDGVKAYKENKCDGIVSLGGGSSHDCGKGIALMIANGGDIRDYEGVNKSTKPMPPFLAINTTAGTASEMTRFCIITNSDTHVKMAIVDWRVTPNVAINDPLLMVGMPPALTAATGMDALTHAVEAYVSTIANPITDACALMAIKLIADYLRPAVANGTNLEARDKMAYAEYLAGMAFNNASLGYVHAMAHQLGGFYNLPHGVCNAILLPEVPPTTRSHVRSVLLTSRLRWARTLLVWLRLTLLTWPSPRSASSPRMWASLWPGRAGREGSRLRSYGDQRKKGRLPVHQPASCQPAAGNGHLRAAMGTAAKAAKA